MTTDPTDWLTRSELPWGRLVSLGPGGFAAYARVRQIPDPERPGMSENDVASTGDGRPERDQAVAVLRVLQAHTSTPDDCYVCVWDGWGTPVPGPVVHLPHRSYGLLRTSLSQLCSEQETPVVPQWLRLAFVWPADRAWCVTHDVDPHWMGVGGSAEAVEELLRHPWLDAVGTDPEQPQPVYDGSSDPAPNPDVRMPRRYPG